MGLQRIRIHTGIVIGLAFLGLQIGFIGYARFIPERFFSWAPYDQHSEYSIDVILGDSPLEPKEVTNRYRYRANGWEHRSINNVFSIIQQYETTYGTEDAARVTVTYSTNGHAEATWLWPPQ